MKKKLKISLILLLAASVAWPSLSPLRAQKNNILAWQNVGFNPNYVISDADLMNYNSLSQTDVQNFLESKPGILATASFIDLDGATRPASEIIFRAGQNYGINPRVILVLLQKEQSLVENPGPSQYNLDWATGYGRCDACDPNDPNIAKFKGFAKQIDSAAGALRFYSDNDKTWLKRPGLIYNINSVPVIPANQATANLYTYTPHLEGNFNFWRTWQKWFSKIFPDGVIVKSGDSEKFWLIQNGKKHLFGAKAAFYSRYDADRLLPAKEADLASYEEGVTFKHPNFSLLKNSKGEIYLLTGNKKRLIEKNAFRHYGFNPDEIIKADDEELSAYLAGEPITVEKKYPLGILLQDKKTGGVYYVADGIKHPIWDRSVMTANFSDKKLRPASAAELEKYPEGEPARFEDGVLVKTAAAPEIYLISNGQRRWIKDEFSFNFFGWQWKQIVTTSERALSLHPPGESIAVNYPAAPLAQAGN